MKKLRNTNIWTHVLFLMRFEPNRCAKTAALFPENILPWSHRRGTAVCSQGSGQQRLEFLWRQCHRLLWPWWQSWTWNIGFSEVLKVANLWQQNTCLKKFGHKMAEAKPQLGTKMQWHNVFYLKKLNWIWSLKLLTNLLINLNMGKTPRIKKHYFKYEWYLGY